MLTCRMVLHGRQCAVVHVGQGVADVELDTMMKIKCLTGGALRFHDRHCRGPVGTWVTSLRDL